MATDSVLGLFQDPSQLQQAQRQQFMENSMGVARLDPSQLASFYAMQGGYGLGNVIGSALGAEDPTLKLMSTRQTILKDYDPNTLEGLQGAAKALRDAGDLQGSYALAQKAQEYQVKIEAKDLDRGVKLEKIRSDAEARAKHDALMKEIAMMRAQQGGETNSLKAQLLQQKIDANLEKADAIKKSALAQHTSAMDTASNVISTVDKALGQVSGSNTGVAGKLMGWTTEAENLEETLGTIKANLGFDRLQQMRNESKTGGALGSVAVKELERLEAARASLSRKQSAEQLKDNLLNVKQSYQRWYDANQAAQEEKTGVYNAQQLGLIDKVYNDPKNKGKTRTQIIQALKAKGVL